MKTISIVIPVFNEEKRLTKTFAALKALVLQSGLKLDEVIFVNDGSTDNSLRLLKAFSSEKSTVPVKVISYPKNKGKGYAVKMGMLSSNADYTLLCDADISTPFSEISKFVDYINNEADIVIGTRKNGKSTVIIHQPLYREVLGKTFTLFTRFFLSLPITDFTCGFKLFSKNSINKIFPFTIIDRWGYDAEILYIAQKRKIGIYEEAVVWSDDRGSHVRIVSASIQTLWEMGKILAVHTFIPKLKKVSVIKISGSYTLKLTNFIADRI